MKLFRKRNKGNNKGFSLVELVCAVAIFGVAATAIGSAMVVSAQSYSRGTYELDVQEEAQTATNIVGNLIFDAVGAKQVDNVVTIDGEGITYTITYDEAAQTLNYTEFDGTNTANGVLAENVTAFDTGLSENSDDLKTNRNVKVEITIEKNGRTYEASYNTTARNGSANAVGVAESATINVDSTVVIEPNQPNLELPVTVLGSVANKTFTAYVASATDHISVNAEMDCVKITATAEAEGPYSIVIQTTATDDTGAPLDTKVVTVQVRRILGINSTKNVTVGSEGEVGSSYEIVFDAVGINLDKVYGRDYDTDYIDPRQFHFEFSMDGAESGKTAADYIDWDAVTYHQTGLKTIVKLSLENEMPMGSKIYVKCISLHSVGKDEFGTKTNKSGVSYGEVSASEPIVKSPITSNGDITRGMDGNVQISIASSLMQQVRNNNPGCTVNKVIRVYEANVDEFGHFTKVDNTPEFYYNSVDAGNDTHVRAVDSKRMIPNQAYIISVSVEAVRADGTVAWPTPSVDPSEYLREFPLSPISITYNSFGGHSGTSSDPYKLTKGHPYNNTDNCPTFNAIGLDMSKGWRDYLAWKVQKKEGGTWVDCTIEIDEMGGTASGFGYLKVKFNETGHYRVLTWMDNAKYNSYTNESDTPDATGDFIFYNVDTGAGMFYVDVE